MAKFTYNDIVTATPHAGPNARPGENAWIVGIIEDRVHFPYPEFPPGVFYTVEFEGGDSTDVHEDNLILIEKAS